MPDDGTDFPPVENGDYPFKAFPGAQMTSPRSNRFEEFFTDDAYVALKNHLYNYLLRKRAINGNLQKQKDELILEVGSGLSPMVTGSQRVIYCELSFDALKALRRSQTRGVFVVADAAHLPFKPDSFPQAICSEVLEHLPDDREALRQMAGVMKTGGSLILTFPHRHRYFAIDDRFVNHFRRYELNEMEKRLREVGLHPAHVNKVLGPLEKVTMMLLTSVIPIVSRLRKRSRNKGGRAGWLRFVTPVFAIVNWLFCLPVWVDARLTPRSLSSVLLIKAVKR
jgi:ubiquinone/menaquinone biosynthesis C-methylase UbiE